MGSRVLAAPLEECLTPGLQTALLGVRAAGPGVRTVRAVRQLPLGLTSREPPSCTLTSFHPLCTVRRQLPGAVFRHVPRGPWARRHPPREPSSWGSGQACAELFGERGGGSPSKDSHVQSQTAPNRGRVSHLVSWFRTSRGWVCLCVCVCVCVCVSICFAFSFTVCVTCSLASDSL